MNAKSNGLRQGELALIGWLVAGAIGVTTSCGVTTAETHDVAESEVALGGESDESLELEAGRRAFRDATFGDESFWGGRLRLHEAIAGESNGGVGPGVSPAEALALGLKVDVAALPEPLRADLAAELVDLSDPAVTLALLKLGAVVGLTGFFDADGAITGLGIQCALCHSVVDDSFAPGIGRRLDGWPNRDLDVGAIVAAAPDLSAFGEWLGADEDAVREVFRGWGRGKFDAFVLLDGKLRRPDGGSAATLIPPLFGLQGVGLVTWNGWGSLASWVPLVINLEMRGEGTFIDRRLNDATQFPVAAANGFGSIRSNPDRVTEQLPALEAYVLSLRAPEPPEGSFEPAAAARGEALFTGKARCSNCHTPPLYTMPGWNLVSPAAIGIDDFQALRSPSGGYRPPPLPGMSTRSKGGFFHDGRFARLEDVVAHFNAHFELALTAGEQGDLVAFLRSL
jgi:hypothetical protein